MSQIPPPFLLGNLNIFEPSLEGKSHYKPVVKSLISTCKKNAKSFKFQKCAVREAYPTKNTMTSVYQLHFAPRAYSLTDCPWKNPTTISLDQSFVHAKEL